MLFSKLFTKIFHHQKFFLGFLRSSLVFANIRNNDFGRKSYFDTVKNFRRPSHDELFTEITYIYDEKVKIKAQDLKLKLVIF